MANQVRLLISITMTLMCSCDKKHAIKNVANVSLKNSHGITMVNDTIFTGTLIAFFNDRDTMEVRNFRDGKRTGLQTRWWDNGHKRSEYNYSNDEFHGVCRDWSATGILVRQMTYHNGYENGLQQLWDDNGKIRANYVARNGRNYGLTGVKACATIWEGDSVRVH